MASSVSAAEEVASQRSLQQLNTLLGSTSPVNPANPSAADVDVADIVDAASVASVASVASNGATRKKRLGLGDREEPEVEHTEHTEMPARRPPPSLDETDITSTEDGGDCASSCEPLGEFSSNSFDPELWIRGIPNFPGRGNCTVKLPGAAFGWRKECWPPCCTWPRQEPRSSVKAQSREALFIRLFPQWGFPSYV
ncbi:unnamed protein product [Symbiodinium natans]|uniref:Uncharacterized protein n=1 Tax=Symbiodinium natans TaxID=878477 RepID=A0A812RNV4_9DINO|nr:unnamed protein product [Symbiodinium natans]